MNEYQKEFEEWFESSSYPLESNWFEKDSEGGYAKSFVSHAFDGWRAAIEFITKNKV